MTPTISVIIPVFNKAAWIEETLNSVASQSFKDWECIIIDDGSTDESLQIIRNFIKNRPETWKIVVQKNQGQCVARNVGIEESTGEYIAFLDGDDCWAENKLKVQLEMLLEDKAASLVLCPYVIYEKGTSKFDQRIVLHRNPKTMLRNWVNLRGFGGGTESTGLIRKDLLILSGGFDTKLSTSAGLDLTMRLNCFGKILIAQNTYMKYRIHTGQWHSNLEVLSFDLNLLREKHFETPSRLRKRTALAHAAYLHLQELREDFSFRKIAALKFNPQSYFFLMVLVFCIVRRNVMARARAIFPRFLTRIPNACLQGSFY